LRTSSCWVWVCCAEFGCTHASPWAFAPLIIRWGADAPCRRAAPARPMLALRSPGGLTSASKLVRRRALRRQSVPAGADHAAEPVVSKTPDHRSLELALDQRSRAGGRGMQAHMPPEQYDRRPCPKCRQPMRLVRTIPALGGNPELLCFTCVACRIAETIEGSQNGPPDCCVEIRR
jgi:hypothetical protein